ncbi:MAG: glycosyltransferase family 2 protein [Planctomycetaceae bacterium]
MSTLSRPLTCLIPCKDEQANIRACIESFRDLADEILIADSGSSDATLRVARQAAGDKVRIIERTYIHSGDFKNWAIPQARHDWVLLVDADERITPKLAEEIRGILGSGKPQDGYWIYRDNYFMGRPIRYGGLQHDCCLRLFRRDVSRYVGNNDHAQVEVSTGRVGTLKHKMKHFSYWTYDAWFRKLDRYTKYQAGVWYRAGRRPSLLHTLTRPLIRFVRDYFFQFGFLDGLIGLQYASMQAFYAFLKQARLWELHCALPQPTDPACEDDTAVERIAA